MAAFEDGADISGIDPWSVAQGTSISTLKFEFTDELGRRTQADPGTAYILTTTKDIEAVQQRDFDTQKPQTWPDGRPILNLVLTGTLAGTNVPEARWRNGSDDDLQRRFFFKAQSMQALQEEMKVKGIKRFGIGTTVKITLETYKPSTKGAPQKIYSVEISNPTPWISPDQQQVESTLAASQPTTPNVQAQTSFPQEIQQAAPAAVPSLQAVAQDQPVQQPAAPTPTPQPAAVENPAPAAASAVTAETIKADYDKLDAVGIGHDLAVTTIATRYGVSQADVDQAIAI